jgi:hypothetical protein
MQCARCNHPDFVAPGTCGRCGFHGDRDQIEELSRLEWLLGEMDTWVDSGILKHPSKRLQNYYLSRRQQVQTAPAYAVPQSSFTERLWRSILSERTLKEAIEQEIQVQLQRAELLPVQFTSAEWGDGIVIVKGIIR